MDDFLKSVAVIQCTADDLYNSNDPNIYCIAALKESELFDDIIIASPRLGDYKKIIKIAKKWNIPCYFGSSYNVAERLYNATKKLDPHVITRVLLKRFYIDLDLVQEMIHKVNEGYDYINLAPDINYEVAADVMSFTALKHTVKLLSAMDDGFKTSVFKFSPWRFIETSGSFSIYQIDHVERWSRKRVEKVKTKLAQLFSGEENKHGIAEGNPASRYQYANIYINSTDRVLDIACGQAGGTKVVAAKAREVIGIDYNKKYINSAINNLPSNVQLIYGTDDILEDYLGYFDKIVSLHTLEHVPDDLSFLKRLYNSLKKGGRLIMEVPRLMPIPLGEPLWPFHEREYNHKLMLNLFEKSGFLVEVVKGGNRGEYVNIEEAREVLFYVCHK